MEKVKKFVIAYGCWSGIDDHNGVGVDWESVRDESGQEVFGVSGFEECPEDAIIGRGLVDANDYLKYLRQGIKLAQEGYTDVAADWQKEE